MNILFISKDLSGADLAYRLQKEGHSVRFFVGDKDQAHNFKGLLRRTTDWKNDLGWVGRDGLIVFDHSGYGEIQDKLKAEGYAVLGGGIFADWIEFDRQYGQKILATCNLKTVPSLNFSSAEETIEFLHRNAGPWVIKQNGHIHSSFNYVGEFSDNRDTISVLKNYANCNKEECHSIDLQKKIEGVEIGVGRYFNGHKWVGPIEMNIEHKGLCEDGLGPKTYEMGTLMWYDADEKDRLFQETLAKMEDYLKKINFCGDIDINCIVNEKGVYPLELTPRFGWPSTHLQEEMHLSPWGEFLKALATGKDFDLKYKKGYGIVVLLATPPFPYIVKSKKYYPKGVEIFFKQEMTDEDLKHIHLEEVSLKKIKKEKQLYISSKTGFVLHVSGSGETIEEAREKTYNLIGKIVIPKAFYRTDIGVKFMQEDKQKLEEWGWI